jgi:hypothetical protein
LGFWNRKKLIVEPIPPPQDLIKEFYDQVVIERAQQQLVTTQWASPAAGAQALPSFQHSVVASGAASPGVPGVPFVPPNATWPLKDDPKDEEIEKLREQVKTLEAQLREKADPIADIPIDDMFAEVANDVVEIDDPQPVNFDDLTRDLAERIGADL